MYRFVPEALSYMFYSFRGNSIESMASHITDYSNNLFSNIFIEIQQPVTKCSYKILTKIKVSRCYTAICSLINKYMGDELYLWINQIYLQMICVASALNGSDSRQLLTRSRTHIRTSTTLSVNLFKNSEKID